MVAAIEPIVISACPKCRAPVQIIAENGATWMRDVRRERLGEVNKRHRCPIRISRTTTGHTEVKNLVACFSIGDVDLVVEGSVWLPPGPITLSTSRTDGVVIERVVCDDGSAEGVGFGRDLTDEEEAVAAEALFDAAVNAVKRSSQ